MDHKNLPLRTGVGIAILNSENKIFVGKRKDNPFDKWQMPQGGINPNEPVLLAMKRELEEETSIKNIKVLKEFDQWLEYELPENLVGIAEKCMFCEHTIDQISCPGCPPGKGGTLGTPNSTHPSPGCSACSVGKSSTGGDIVSCKTCVKGRYGHLEDHIFYLIKCAKCASGRWSNETGKANKRTCKPCNKGTYNNKRGSSASSECLECPKGRYNSEDGANHICL